MATTSAAAATSTFLSGSATAGPTGTVASTILNTLTTSLIAATSTSSVLSATPTVTTEAGGHHGPQDEKTKIIGLTLAIGSGLLIGSSFVFKKKGLLNCTKNGMLAGEGHEYLKSAMWWTGMLMMVAGEVCNFVAYAFVQPILVTPLGALSVVICAILSSIFLKERLNLQGKVGCAQCIVGATIIVLHAPEQTPVKTIEEFRHFMVQPAFMTWMIIIIVASVALIVKAGPKWGKTHMMIYIGVCSLIGSLSVVATQALGAAIVHTISTGEPQFNNWFVYFVIVFMVITLLTEINYLNKALNLFNTAMVTPTYYVTFTSTTIITSAILYQGFATGVVTILTVCLGFLVICGGVLLLQTSKPVMPIHVSGPSSVGMVGTITYDDIEPNAADMRASPFSSIRRITRDLRQPSSHIPFQSSPLNPRAESLLQRKRRASNAAQNQMSRPASTAGGGYYHGNHTHLGVSHLATGVASPGGGASDRVVAGTTTAFYPSTQGAYSTLVMGPNGSQVRLQLCEIVVSDEKNETSRYQVYRPVTSADLNKEKERVPGAAVAVGTTTSYKHPFLAPRGSLLTDSRSSSIRFNEKNAPRLSTEEVEREKEGEASPSPPQPQQQPSNHSSAISGSLFLPPRIAVSPPTPAPSTPPLTSSPLPQTPTSPSSGPMATGGSFFTRPKFRTPSTSTVASGVAATGGGGGGGGGDIMDLMSEAGQGRTVVSIEPVQQLPLYSIYVPPPSISHSAKPSSLIPQANTSTSLSTSTSTSSSSSNANDLSSLLHTPASPSPSSVQHPQSSDVDPGSTTVEMGSSGDAVAEPSLSSSSSPTKNKQSLFGKMFGKKAAATPTAPSSSNAEASSSTAPSPPLASQIESSSSPSTEVLSSAPPPPPLFHRSPNHPTRISEGEEEEDAEETLKRV